MSAFAALLQSPDPRRASVRRVAARQTNNGDPVESLISIVEGATSDPLGQEMLRGILQDRLNIRIPTRAEKELSDAQTAQAQQDLARKQKQEDVRNTLGFLVDNAQAPADQAFVQFAESRGISLGANAIKLLSVKNSEGKNETVEQVLNKYAQAHYGDSVGRLDGSLIQNPSKLTTASLVMGDIVTADFPDNIRPDLANEFRIGYGDLLDFGLTKEQATKTQTDIAREELAASASASLHTAQEEKAGEVFREGFLGPMLEKVEDSLGVDLTSNIFGRGDVDSALGVRGFAMLNQLTRAHNPSLSGKQLVDRLLPLYVDSEIPDIITEGSHIEEGPGGQKTLVPDNPVSALYAHMLRNLSADSGVPEGDIYARLQIPATRADGDAIQAQTAEARRTQ